MSVINLNLEDDLTALLHESNQPIQKTVREFVVLELYRRGAISSAKTIYYPVESTLSQKLNAVESLATRKNHARTSIKHCNTIPTRR